MFWAKNITGVVSIFVTLVLLRYTRKGPNCYSSLLQNSGEIFDGIELDRYSSIILSPMFKPPNIISPLQQFGKKLYFWITCGSYNAWRGGKQIHSTVVVGHWCEYGASPLRCSILPIYQPCRTSYALSMHHKTIPLSLATCFLAVKILLSTQRPKIVVLTFAISICQNRSNGAETFYVVFLERELIISFKNDRQSHTRSICKNTISNNDLMLIWKRWATTHCSMSDFG